MAHRDIDGEDDVVDLIVISDSPLCPPSRLRITLWKHSNSLTGNFSQTLRAEYIRNRKRGQFETWRLPGGFQVLPSESAHPSESSKHPLYKILSQASRTLLVDLMHRIGGTISASARPEVSSSLTGMHCPLIFTLLLLALLTPNPLIRPSLKGALYMSANLALGMGNHQMMDYAWW